jgi:hypothetical protein
MYCCMLSQFFLRTGLEKQKAPWLAAVLLMGLDLDFSVVTQHDQRRDVLSHAGSEGSSAKL